MKHVKFDWNALSTKGKIWHIIKVVLSLLAVLAMCAVFLYIMLIVFSLGGLILELRDLILKDLIHWIIG